MQLTTSQLEGVLEECIDAARFAGTFLGDYFYPGATLKRRKMDEVPEGIDPSTFNVVSDVDLALQAHVARRLLDKFPDFEFFGEEDPAKVFDPIEDRDIIERIQTNHSRYQFIVDPLDGTGRYLALDARFGIFIGLLEDNNFVLAVGYNPKQFSMTYAIRGQGCYMDGNKFRFNSTIDDHLVLNTKANRTEAFKAELQDEGLFLMRPKHTGTMYDMLFLQHAFGMVSLKTNTHDHPLSLAVEEAGGTVLVYDGKQFVRGSQFNWRNESSKKDANIPAYIAANTEENALALSKRVLKYLAA
ncbi:hypothetical protein KY360_04130 [Candidatus Woesearchaeota archaeon]|nr:hypothetical protein [Candidatus Woesearchaeota archaeon]